MKNSLLFLVAIFFVGLFAVGCGPAAVKTDADGNEDFESFYARFHQDTVFQFQRIEFPLAGIDANGNEKVWTEEEWKWLKAVDPKNEDIKLFREKEAGFVKERLIFQDAFMMERNFTYDKSSKRWLLTYYTDLHFPSSKNSSRPPSDTTTIDSIPSDHPNVEVEIVPNKKGK
jgi:hypothetical protein